MPRVQIKNKFDNWITIDKRTSEEKRPRVEYISHPPENLSDACLIISEELKQHGDFYKSFVESVQSAIREVPEGIELWSNELAEKIVKRIAGEE